VKPSYSFLSGLVLPKKRSVVFENSKELKVMLALSLKGAAVLSGFFLNLVLARRLGAGDLGVFNLIFTGVLILSSITRLGTDQSLVKHVNTISSTREKEGLVLSALIAVSILSLIVSLILYFFAGTVSVALFSGVESDSYVRVVAPCIFFVAVYFYCSTVFLANSHATRYIVGVSLIMPLFFLIFILVFDVKSLRGVSFSYSMSCCLTCVVCFFGVFKFRYLKSMAAGLDVSISMAKKSPYYVALCLVQILNLWGPQIIIGLNLSTFDVGVYSTAYRVSLLFTSITVAVNAVFSAKIIEASSKCSEKLRALVVNAMLITLLLSLSFLLLVSVFANVILTAFGEDFYGASSLLRQLSFSQFLYVMATPLVWYLLGRNKERLMLVVSTGMLLVGSIVTYICTLKFGSPGMGVGHIAASLIFLIAVIFGALNASKKN